MKRILLYLSTVIVLFCFIQLPVSVLAISEADNSKYELENNNIKYIIDRPASLDAYLICKDKSETEIWHIKLYSYDYISGVSMEQQKVDIISFEFENDMIKVIDSRNVIYYVDLENGDILEVDNKNYVLPDFSDTSNNDIDDNDGVVKYLAIIVAFIAVGLLVFVASRNKK